MDLESRVLECWAEVEALRCNHRVTDVKELQENNSVAHQERGIGSSDITKALLPMN